VSLTTPAHPAERLEAAFRSIHERRMQGLPLLNSALAVEAVGFGPWESHWLGVLITPWFMNLMLIPREPEGWRGAAAGDAVAHLFPAGSFEFIAGRDEALGDYQSCSLFSPMFEFADQDSARLTAVAALRALFDATHGENVEDIRQDAQGNDAAIAGLETGKRQHAESTAPMTKREFLRGGFIPDTRESGR
jgi:[NiFe] hydrogenase assembly HybE family chaperone